MPITDEGKIIEIGRQISPDHSRLGRRPAHPDLPRRRDLLVPIQQAEIIVDKLKEAGVEAKLVVKPGAGHGWPDKRPEIAQMIEWFDKYLQTPKGS